MNGRCKHQHWAEDGQGRRRCIIVGCGELLDEHRCVTCRQTVRPPCLNCGVGRAFWPDPDSRSDCCSDRCRWAHKKRRQREKAATA